MGKSPAGHPMKLALVIACTGLVSCLVSFVLFAGDKEMQDAETMTGAPNFLAGLGLTLILAALVLVLANAWVWALT